MLNNLQSQIRKRGPLIGGILIIVIMVSFVSLIVWLESDKPQKSFPPMVQSNASFTDDGVKKVKLSTSPSHDPILANPILE